MADPVWNGVVRTLNWLGFHAVLVIGAVIVVVAARRAVEVHGVGVDLLCRRGVGLAIFPAILFPAAARADDSRPRGD